jgi:hypothetical protein
VRSWRRIEHSGGFAALNPACMAAQAAWGSRFVRPRVRAASFHTFATSGSLARRFPSEGGPMSRRLIGGQERVKAGSPRNARPSTSPR